MDGGGEMSLYTWKQCGNCEEGIFEPLVRYCRNCNSDSKMYSQNLPTWKNTEMTPFPASMDFSKNLDDVIKPFDRLLDVWQYIQNKSNAKFSNAYWDKHDTMRGEYTVHSGSKAVFDYHYS